MRFVRATGAGRTRTAAAVIRAGAICALALTCLAPAQTGAGAAESDAAGLDALLARAGNTSDDSERHELLERIAGLGDLDPGVRADLDKILPVARGYAAIDREPAGITGRGTSSENGYLCFFYPLIRRTPNVPSADYPPAVAPESPLFPIHCLYRGRMLIWYPIQRGAIAQDPRLRGPWFDEGRRLLGIAAAAYPGNRVARMYLGEPIPWPSRFVDDPRAPEWANLQRAGLEKWADVVEWWIDNRQLATGEFGGGWGDDVEFWRTWPAVLVAFKDPKIEAAQERISEGVFAMPHLREGFAKTPHDAEHSAEDTADSITPMMLIRPGDARWAERAGRIVELMRERWTGTNERGELQFRGAYVGSDGVDPLPERAVDTAYHFRTMQPALHHWQRTGDAETGAVLSQWIATWVNAALRAERGKPAGIPPSAIRWPSGTAGGSGGDWWRAGFYSTGLYDFPAAVDEMLPSFVLAYRMTGDRRFLEPIVRLAELSRAVAADSPAGADEPGSTGWSVRRLSSALADVLPKYRRATGDTQFDDLILAGGDGHARFWIAGDTGPLLADLRRMRRAMSVNFEAYTSEVRWTDRIQAFHGKYLNHYLAEKIPGLSLRTLYAMATGDAGDPRYFPMNAVRWHTPPRAIAALVRAATADEFEAELYHFGDEPRRVGVETLQLAPGSYRLTLRASLADTSGDAGLVSESGFEVSGTSGWAEIELPAGRLCELRIARR